MLVEELLKGNILSLYVFDNYRYMEEVRISEYRDEIVAKHFEKLKDKFPIQTYILVRDLPEYRLFCEKTLMDNFNKLNSYFLKEYFLNLDWAMEFLTHNIDKLLTLEYSVLNTIISYIIAKGNMDLLKKLCYYDDLRFRGELMLILVKKNPQLFQKIYENITNYLFKVNEKGQKEMIDQKRLCRLAYFMIKKEVKIGFFEDIYEFILDNYEKNDLARALNGDFREECLDNDESYPGLIQKDLSRLYNTSINYQFELFYRYPQFFDKEMLKELQSKLEGYINLDCDVIRHLFRVGLGDSFLEISNKYLELISGAKCVKDAGKGKATRAFIVGDYTVKCSYNKWAKSKCPNLFLIAKNYDEAYAYDDYGRIIGAVEVQKYYKKPFIHVNSIKGRSLVKKIYKEFEKLGYELTEVPFGYEHTPNFFYLDSYKEADCDDPEKLPSWFKKNPIVLVDRDYVFKKVK